MTKKNNSGLSNSAVVLVFFIYIMGISGETESSSLSFDWWNSLGHQFTGYKNIWSRIQEVTWAGLVVNIRPLKSLYPPLKSNSIIKFTSPKSQSLSLQWKNQPLVNKKCHLLDCELVATLFAGALVDFASPDGGTIARQYVPYNLPGQTPVIILHRKLN